LTRARAPGAKRASAHAAETAAEEPVVEDGWQIRARQLLRARVTAAYARAKQILSASTTAAIDKGIATLQRLRKRTGGAERPDECRANDRERPAKPAPTQRTKGEPVALAPIAPKPRRRLRSLLLYLGVMLAGGMGGTALAYDLLARLLDRQSAEIKRLEVKLSKYSKSAVEMRKKLEQQQAKQIEAETRLAAALAQNEKTLGEVQAKRAEAEARLASAIAGRASDPQRQEDTDSNRGSRGAARSGQAGWTRAGNCTLGSSNVRSVLNGCIADMDRR